MTDTDTRPLNGQDIGQAELALRAVLDDLLADSGSTFQQWVALNVIGDSPSVLNKDDLADRMVQILRVDDGIASSIIEGLVDLQLVDVDKGVQLTTIGKDRLGRIRAKITEIMGHLYSDVPLDDLITARRVLATLTNRANAAMSRG
ncbi:MAG TPA: hypothetical protein VGV86_04300 [Acidimicrobiales bacterium]|nr:hypothetical protein [Acidimicrobiales bacterium]